MKSIIVIGFFIAWTTLFAPLSNGISSGFKRLLKFHRPSAIWVVALFSCLLTACSTQHTIHLFGADEKLSKPLEAINGYKVIARGDDNIEAFSQHTLISPSDLSEQELQDLIKLLKQQDIEIDHIAYGSYRNHSYQNGNIGLYLATNQPNDRLDIPATALEQVDFSGKYKSIDCPNNWHLELKTNRRWKAQSNKKEIKGYWRNKGRTLTLLFTDSRIRFDGHHNKKHNNALQLIPFDYEESTLRCQYRKQEP